MKPLVNVLAAAATFLFSESPASAATLSGTLTNNMTLSGTNILQGTVVVTNGIVLTLEPGTRLLMSTGATLLVHGQLLAGGTSNAPIHFTREAAGQRWKQIRFVQAAHSLLRHCVIEFADSVGTHLDYYDDDCDTNTQPPARNYHEAVVAVASPLDIENCLFRNLPDTGSTAEGDAIAIISDDPQTPGPASARIRSCQFPSIGQGIHTRHSYVLVEHCLFSGKRGDNDDIDLYGESDPVPLIRNNTFLAGHEDKINPTRCSAIIVNNFISGSDDHGIVLRDKCRPIVFNNVISNCASAAISVQNQCDALIANNTIVSCGRGVRLFDHTSRHGPPYCLFPGNGRATVVNCIIWDWTIAAFELEQSAFEPHPDIAVFHCDIEPGANLIVTNGANNTVVWGPGNFGLGPQFTNALHLRAGSPCIDAGTNISGFATNFTVAVTNDHDAVPRPLDGDGDGAAAFDVGAFEHLLATADSNGDGIPDGWTWQHGLNPAAPDVGTANPDGDPHTTFEEWVADTDPADALSFFRIESVAAGPPATVSFSGSSNRLYTLIHAPDFNTAWTRVAGQIDVPGNGTTTSLADTNALGKKFYRVEVKVP